MLAYLEAVDWQQMAALVIVALATVLLLWGWLRPRRRLSGTDAGCCGCAGNQTRPKASIIIHARKGERPRMIFRA